MRASFHVVIGLASLLAGCSVLESFDGYVSDDAGRASADDGGGVPLSDAGGDAAMSAGDAAGGGGNDSGSEGGADSGGTGTDSGGATAHYLYVLGGNAIVNGNQVTSADVLSAPIHPDGALGAWTHLTAMPTTNAGL